MFGFEFSETLRGTYHLLANPLDEQSIDFSIRVEGRGARRFIREKIAEIHGHVTLKGLAENRPLQGTLAFKLVDEQRLSYDFTFEGDDRRPYRLRGQKDWSIFSVADSLSILPATVYDGDGVEIGRALLRFDLRGDTKKLLKSFRLTRG